MAHFFVLTSIKCFSVFLTFHSLILVVAFLGQRSKRHISAAMLWHSFHINKRTSQKEWPIRKCDGLFFPRWSQLVADIILRFALINLSGQLSRSVVKLSNFYWSAFTQTDLQVRRSGWSGSVTACFLRHLSGHISRSAVQAPHFYNSFHTNGPTGQTECLIWKYEDLFFPPWTLSQLLVLFLL